MASPLPLKKEKYNYVAFAYLSPWIIGFLVFQFYPLIASLFYSFTDYNLMKTPNFIGLKNYVYMFTEDDLFFHSLKVTLYYVLLSVPAKVAFALLIAIALNVQLKGINLFRTIYYIPSILGGSVAISVLWRFLFARDGVINQVLSVFSVPSIDWLGDPSITLFTISLLSVWQFGSSMVLFLAGLKQVPKELYEASRIDGASNFRMFISITLPFLTPILFFNLIMQMIHAFQEFTAAFIITEGGPMRATYLYGLMLYQNGFQYLKMGYASALSWVLFIIIMVLTLVVFKFSSNMTHYEDGGK